MGPEEIHIYLWEGASRPPKRKCDRPKNLDVFLVNFQIRYIALPFHYIFIYLFFYFFILFLFILFLYLNLFNCKYM